VEFAIPVLAATIMLLVKTYLDKSPIHGLGVFAGQPIRKGAKIWRFVFGFDRYYTRKKLAKLPKPARDFIKLHGYQWKKEILLSMDHDTFMNHADEANTYYQNGYVIARCDIREGEEITNDYRAFEASFCASFLKKGNETKALKNGHAVKLANGHGVKGVNGHVAKAVNGNGSKANGHGAKPRNTRAQRSLMNGNGRHHASR
jgi:hypothetical protein